MRLSQIGYGAMQIGIVGTIVYFYSTGPGYEPERPISPIAIAFIAVGCAAIVTAIVYWTGRGIRRLFGYPAGEPLVTPRGAFENLRRPPRDSGALESGGDTKGRRWIGPGDGTRATPDKRID